MSKVKKSTKSQKEILAINAESNRKWLENKKKPAQRGNFGFFPMKSKVKKEEE